MERVHDRSCGEAEAVLAYGSAAGSMGMKRLGSTIFAEVGGATLQDGLGSRAKPEFLCALDAFVELLDQRLHDRAGHRKALATIARVIHAWRILDDILQNSRHDLAGMAGSGSLRRRSQ